MMSPSPVHVTVTCDEAYVPHVAAMLVSAVRASPGVHVHLLHPEAMNPEALEPIRRIVERAGGELHPVEVLDSRVEALNEARFSRTAWYRTLAPELCPQLDRIVHLDADATVHASLDELWRTDLDGQPLAAVENPLYPWMRPAADRLGLPSGTPYLNSGVLVMDLAALRRENAVERLLHYGTTHPDNPWPEQDALSFVFAGQWTPLPPRWNAQATVYELRVSQLPWTSREIRDARRRPAVRHFSGPFKPWNGHPDRGVVTSYNRRREQAGYEPVDVRSSVWRQAWLRALPGRLQHRAILLLIRRMKEKP